MFLSYLHKRPIYSQCQSLEPHNSTDEDLNLENPNSEILTKKDHLYTQSLPVHPVPHTHTHAHTHAFLIYYGGTAEHLNRKGKKTDTKQSQVD